MFFMSFLTDVNLSLFLFKCLSLSHTVFPSVHQPNGPILSGMGYGQQFLKV